MEYLQKLHDKHEFLNNDHFKKCEHLVINNENDKSSDEYKENLEKIISFIFEWRSNLKIWFESAIIIYRNIFL